MRILTVRQPWAWAIIHGGKDVENRVRNIAGTYRGPIAVHVGLRDDDYWDESIAAAFIPSAPSTGWPWPTYSAPYWANYGNIIGVVDLDGVHHAESCHGRVDVEEVSPNLVRGYYAPTCSQWADLNAWHLCLTNSRPLAVPIPFKGALGLRTLPDDVAAQVLAGVAK